MSTFDLIEKKLEELKKKLDVDPKALRFLMDLRAAAKKSELCKPGSC